MRIIIMPLYGIGDALMSTPALRNIKEQTDAHITYLHMFKPVRDILLNNPNVDENILFPFLYAGKMKSLKFLLSLRGKYDVSINFYPSNRKDYSLATFAVGCPIRIGHRYKLRDWAELNFLKNKTLLEDDSLHNVEENLRLLSFIGIKKPRPYPLEIYLTEEEKNSAEGWLKENNISGRTIIGLHPGSSVFKQHAKKRWPIEKFSELIREIGRVSADYVFALFGGKEEDPLKEKLRETTGIKDRVFPVSKDSIRQTAAIMSRCRIFITNDSGLMHLAAALQIPTVALFGPTNPVWLHPWMCPHRVIRLGRHCSPCFRYSPIPQRCLEGEDFSCMRDIEVPEVLSASLELIRES